MLDTGVYQVDLEYERSKHNFDVLRMNESIRQLRLGILLLENENDDLHQQLTQDDSRIDSLESRTQALQHMVELLEADLSASNAELRIRNRELDNIKAEVNSLQSVSMDSTKLLTEKLALSRELATIAPEVEHLRSQAASHQTLLSEKLSLQRQLSTVQVELETEKRATLRALAKEGGRKAQDAQLESQIEELQAETVKERRLRQNAERELQQTTAKFESKQASLELTAGREMKNTLQEAENAQTVLSSRLDAFRTKLRAAKEQLKDAQEELNDARLKPTVDAAAVGPRQEKTNSLASQKRSIAQVDVSNIGTPDGMPFTKRARQGSVLPSDKSTFSITPFLNKIASVAPESPPSANAVRPSTGLPANAEQDDAIDAHEAPGDDPLAKASLVKRRGGSLTGFQPPRANKKGAPVARTKKVSKLEQVQEEGEDEPPARAAAPVRKNKVVASKIVEDTHQSHNVDDTTFLKRKRKLLSAGGLGRTLFDDVEGEEDGHTQKGTSALRKPLQSGVRKGLQMMKVETAVGGFGAISPLKKDKRTGKSGGA